MTAAYGGSGNYNASTSDTVMQVVAPVGTSLVLSAAPNPANFGQMVTLTAVVATGVSGIPAASGTVTFGDQSGVLGSVAIGGGTATFQTSSLSIGPHNITASYSGEAGYTSAISNSVAEVIQSYEFSLHVSPTELSLPSGDYAVMNVTVSPIGGFRGTVSISCTGVPLNAQCVFQPGTTVSLAGGAQQIKMVFNTSELFESGTQVARLAGRGGPASAMVFLPLIALLGGSRRRRLVTLAVVFVMCGLQGCSGKLPGYTLPGSYAVTVTASDAASGLTHSVVLEAVIK